MIRNHSRQGQAGHTTGMHSTPIPAAVASIPASQAHVGATQTKGETPGMRVIGGHPAETLLRWSRAFQNPGGSPGGLRVPGLVTPRTSPGVPPATLRGITMAALKQRVIGQWLRRWQGLLAMCHPVSCLRAVVSFTIYLLSVCSVLAQPSHFQSQHAHDKYW